MRETDSPAMKVCACRDRFRVLHEHGDLAAVYPAHGGLSAVYCDSLVIRPRRLLVT